MQEPIWISEHLAQTIHERQLAEHGGIEGVRDEGLLSSALARPRHLLVYSKERPHIAELAAAYGFGIAKNHAFLDGNKRTAYVVTRTFLKINGYDFDATQEAKFTNFLKLAEGNLSETELVDWLKQRINQN